MAPGKGVRNKELTSTIDRSQRPDSETVGRSIFPPAGPLTTHSLLHDAQRARPARKRALLLLGRKSKYGCACAGGRQKRGGCFVFERYYNTATSAALVHIHIRIRRTCSFALVPHFLFAAVDASLILKCEDIHTYTAIHNAMQPVVYSPYTEYTALR